MKEPQRQALWSIFEQVRKDINRKGLITQSELFNRLAEHFARSTRPYNFVVVDECQDVGIAELRFLAAIGADDRNALFFAGDLGQRIFQQPFSWKACGVDIRGRSTTLRINYRTSHQIRTQADKLLGPSVSDVDGTCITSSICGLMSGAGKWQRGMSLSPDMLMIWCWVFSTERMPNASLESSRNGWQSSAWNYIRTRRD